MKATLTFIVVLMVSALGFAQGSDVRTYRIQVDDVLRIQVYGEPQINAVEVPVAQDGTISAPFVGTIKAEGKTTAELEAELRDAYKDKLRLRDPKVSITFSQFHPYRAFIGGAIQKPGQYLFRPGDTILTLIHQGGDPIEGLADQHRAILRRKGSEEAIPIDLFAMLRKGDTSQNYELQDGDDLEVPADAKSQIKVIGFVQRPSQYAYREPMTLADALSQAGGEVPGRSQMSKVSILRELPAAPGTFVQIKCDFVRYVTKGDSTQNIELQPGDLIYVPAVKFGAADISTAANFVNAAFLFENFFRNGLFGFRFFH